MANSRKRQREDLNVAAPISGIFNKGVWQVVAEHAPLQIFNNAVKVSRHFNSLFKGKHYWYKIIRHHFPFYYLDSEMHNQDWSALYKKIEEKDIHYWSNENKSIPIQKIRCAFSLAKDGALDDFKKVFDLRMLAIMDIHDFTVIHWAARYQHQNILDYIFHTHINLRYSRWMNHLLSFIPINMAMRDELIEQLVLAIKCKQPINLINQYISKIGHQTLTISEASDIAYAVSSVGYLNCLKWLIENNILPMNWNNYWIRNLPSITCRFGWQECLEYLITLSPPKNITACVEHAAYQGNEKALLLLLNYGIHTDNNFKEHALHESLMNGHASCFTLLVQFGADINHTYDYSENDVYTLLSYVLRNGNTAQLRMLLDNGANLNHMNITSRMITKLINQPDLTHLNLLLNHGADSNLTTTGGISLLYKAVLHGNLQAIRVLLLAGADMNQTTKVYKKNIKQTLQQMYGRLVAQSMHQFCLVNSKSASVKISPLQLARIIGNDQVIEILTQTEQQNRMRRHL